MELEAVSCPISYTDGHEKADPDGPTFGYSRERAGGFNAIKRKTNRFSKTNKPSLPI